MLRPVPATMGKRFFGQYLLSKGLITAPRLLAAVEYQEKYNSRLGDLAVALGMVTPFEAQQINAKQVREDRLFGQAAVELGLLSDQQVRDVLATQRDSHVLLGQAVATLGYLDRSAVDSALADFLEAIRLEPECAVLPEEVRDGELACALFDLAQKLLLRAWDVTSKPGLARIERMRLTLSDHNARVELSGTLAATVMVGVPNEVAVKAAKRFSGEDEPDDRDREEAVQEFAKVLCDNLASTLAERGHRVQVEAAATQVSRATLPPEMKVVVVPYLTHLGQVLIGLSV